MQLKHRTTSLRDTTRCGSADRRHLIDRTRLPPRGGNLSVTTAEPATEMSTVAAVAPAKVVATAPADLHHSLRRLADGSRPPTPRGSLPPFGWGPVPTPLRPITGRHSLSPRSSTRSPVGSSYDSLSLAGGLRAYHVASPKPAWVRSRLYAGGSSSAPGKFGVPGPGHVPFWSKPVSTFGLSYVTTLTAVHLG